MRKILFTIIALFFAVASFSQMPAPKEGWIAVPGSSAQDYGVYVFMKEAQVSNTAQRLRVWVTGDNRYKLFVNGKIVSIGPARSDLQHWNCEEVDLAPYLHDGKNTVAALVWNEGSERPVANMTYRTGFFLHAIDNAASVFNTDTSWKCVEDKSYSPVTVRVPGYYAAGPGERVDFHDKVLSGKVAVDKLSGGKWQNATVISGANYVGQQGAWGTYLGWMLKKSGLPQRELKLERLAKIRELQNVKADGKFLQGNSPITIPANTTAKIIVDNNVETNAYVTLKFSGGDNSKIALGYTEAFYESLPQNMIESPAKGNRNEVKGKFFIGRTDTVISNGKSDQEFTTLAWRTYRYIVLTVKTQTEPITIDDLYGTFTGFPFQLKASIVVPLTSAAKKHGHAAGVGEATKDYAAVLQEIFSMDWRTARLCAIETYMDCPYYEQMQYFGDARIQALVSLYMTGDDRLVKQLLDAADWSRGADGVTQSRYPASLPQWIQPYALHYIYTLHDYLMYGNDTTFLKTKLMAERTILDYFHRYQTVDGRVKNLPGWNFTDWVDNNSNWKDGVALPGEDGSNAVMDFQLLYAYEMAADLEDKLGMKDYAALYNQRAAQLKATIINNYWRADKGLFSDRSDGDVFSQHANAFAILTDVFRPLAGEAFVPSRSQETVHLQDSCRPLAGEGFVPSRKGISISGRAQGSTLQSLNIAKKLESDSTLAPASIYFKFYTHQAMVKAGLGNDYVQWLGIWRKYLQLGLSTCGETSDVNSTRSECHAWGASPNVEIFRTVLGIDSDAPCFSRVAITPHLGTIRKIGGTMPTPYGDITVSYQVKGKALTASVTLPSPVTGSFYWNGKEYKLNEGENKFTIE